MEQVTLRNLWHLVRELKRGCNSLLVSYWLLIVKALNVDVVP